MRKIKILTLLLAFGVFAQGAFALNQLALVSGASTLVINDNVAPDANPAAGTLVYFNPNFNSWNISVVAGQSNAPGLTPFALDLAVLATCTSGNCATQDLYVGLGSFSVFTTPTPSFNSDFSSTQTLSLIHI